MVTNRLKKHLGLAELVIFGIGAIIGTGVFVLPALAAQIAGVASFWVWLQLGMLTIFMAFCFAELSSVHPDAGGPFKFVTESFGRFAGFLSGWSAWVISWITIASLAIAAAYYLSYFYPMGHLGTVVVAIAVLGLITLINIKGAHWGVKAQYLLTTATILVLWWFITWGIYFIKLENYVPKAPITFSSLMLASALVIEPFIGWETITYFAEEAKNPKRDMPKAIIYSSVIVTLFYSAVIFVALGLLDSQQLAISKFPLITAAEVFLGSKAVIAMALGGILVLFGCLNSWVVSTARLPYAMARDGMFPPQLAKTHGKHSTPVASLLFQFAFASMAILIGEIEAVISVLVVVVMFLYIAVFASIPVQRRKGVEIPYKLPFGALVPAISVGVCLLVLSQVKFLYLVAGIGVILLGVPVYCYMDRKYKR